MNLISLCQIKPGDGLWMVVQRQNGELFVEQHPVKEFEVRPQGSFVTFVIDGEVQHVPDSMVHSSRDELVRLLERDGQTACAVCGRIGGIGSMTGSGGFSFCSACVGALRSELGVAEVDAGGGAGEYVDSVVDGNA